MMMKVGLVTGVSKPSPVARPWTKQVLPTPMSPNNATTAGGRKRSASSAASRWVSAGLDVIVVFSEMFITFGW